MARLLFFPFGIVVVRAAVHDGCFVEIMDRWRGRSLPFETGGLPWIGRRFRTVVNGPDEIDHGQEISNTQDAGTGRGENMVNLEFYRIGMVTARHAEIAEDELREEGEVKADECHEGGE